MANSDYLIAGNDEHGLEPLPTGNVQLLPPEKVPIYLVFVVFSLYNFYFL